jgi:Immunoglobulin domain/Immunoglobulin I-set domain
MFLKIIRKRPNQFLLLKFSHAKTFQPSQLLRQSIFQRNFLITALQKSTGSSVELTCHSNGFPKPDIKWSFVNKSGQRTNLSSAIDTVVIENLNFTHDGRYECEVFNGIGETQKRVIELKVGALEGPILVERTGAIIMVKTNEVKTLVCGCEHCLPMRSHAWTFKGIPINETIVENVRMNHTELKTDQFKTTLTLDHVVHDNEGVYKCELNNDLGSTSHEMLVNILKKPVIQHISVSNSTVRKEGDCSVY